MWCGIYSRQMALLLGILMYFRGCWSLTYKVQSDEEKLLDYLFQDYNPSARPVLNSTKTVTVNIQFSLLQMQELNIRSQVFTTTGMVILDWYDERLTWDREISTLDEMVINGRSIWKPEFAVINGAEGIYGEYNEFQAVLHPSGHVRWEPGGVFKTMCQIDITYYPFDEQRCELIFGAWSYYTTKMNLTTNSTTVNKDTYEQNGEWRILNTGVVRREFNFECCPDQKFSNVAFGIHLERRHTFYIMNVILPGILTSAVLLSIFFCTPSQKVHIGVAALLSFRLFLLNVADTIPRTSDHVPLLGIYLTCTLAITTMAMVATVFVLNLYATKEKPVPLWAKKVFVIYMARILCMCNCISPQEPRDDRSTVARRRHKYKLVLEHDSGTQESDVDRGGLHAADACPLEPLVPRDAGSMSSGSRRASSAHASPMHQAFLSDQARRRGTSAEGRGGGGGGSKRSKPDYAKDWVHVALVCDRFFFWLCLIFITCTTMLLFHPLTTSKYFKIPNIDKGAN